MQTSAAGALGALGSRVWAEPNISARLDAHTRRLPEADPHGSNHYPMAVDTLIVLGRYGEALRHLRGYRGQYDGKGKSVGPIAQSDWKPALGGMKRYADWLAFFRREIKQAGVKPALATWCRRLAPGMSGVAFHGVIRTAHAMRAHTREPSGITRAELAAGLAYWASRYLALPTTGKPRDPTRSFTRLFMALAYPWPDKEPPVNYFRVNGASLEVPGFVPPVAPEAIKTKPADDLARLVGACATYFIQMARARRNSMVPLHGVTGPASIQLLLPHVPRDVQTLLVEHAWQGAAALFTAYGKPMQAHRPAKSPEWTTVLARAVQSNDAHAIKLAEAMHRFDKASPSPVFRQAAWTWVG